MSSASTPAGNDRYVDFDEYVEFQLNKTRKSIKANDLITAVAVAGALVLGWLLAFVVLDHWVFAAGFSVPARWCWFVAFAGTVLGWLVWKIGVPSFRRVNRLFAAKELEEADPALKSNLLNWVDLRDAGCKVHPAVMQTIEKQAATELSKMDVGQAVDHRPLLTASYALLGVVVLFCGYALFSPKKISSALWRVLPFTQGGAVTRTEIREVIPGDATLMSRGRLEVAVTLGGEIPDAVELRYTTADGRIQDEAVVLRPESEGLTRFRGVFAGENGNGVLQDFSYRIVAGDAQSSRYRVTVHQPPSATVNQVALKFPEYMKLDDSTIAGGNIDGWEGAEAAISATADKPCHSAVLQFLNDPQSPPTGEEVSVQVTDGTQLSANWTLALRSDNTFPKHYRIVCRNDAGEVDPSPTVYSVAIKPDRPPEVVLLHPERDLVAPANAVIPLLVQASDPDFELGYINLLAEKDGQPIPRRPLSEGKQQKLTLQHDFELAPLGLKPGDEIEFWVEAFDNKQPRRNRKNTPRLKIRIEEPVSKQQAAEDLAEAKQERDERMAEAQQEAQRDPQENADRDRGDEDEDRDPKESERDPQQPRDPAEQQPDEGQEKGAEAQPGDAGGKPQPGKNAQPNGQTGEKQAGDGEGKSEQQPDEPPLNPDGTDDDEALRKINQNLSDSQRNKPDSPNDKRGEKTSSGTKPKPGTQDDAANSDPSPDEDAEQPPGESNPAANSPKPANNKKQKSLPKPGDKNSRDPSSARPGEESPKPSEATEPGEKTDTAPPSKTRPPGKGDQNPKTGKTPDSDAADSDPKTGDDDASEQPEGSEEKPTAKSDPNQGQKLPKGNAEEKTPGKNPSPKTDEENPGDAPQPKNTTDDEQDAEDSKQKEKTEADAATEDQQKQPKTGKGQKDQQSREKPDKSGAPGGGGDDAEMESDETGEDSSANEGGEESDSNAQSGGEQKSKGGSKSKGGKSSPSKGGKSSPSGGESSEADDDGGSDSEESGSDEGDDSQDGGDQSSEQNASSKKQKKPKGTSKQPSGGKNSASKQAPKSTGQEDEQDPAEQGSDGSENPGEGDEQDADGQEKDDQQPPKTKPGNKDPNAKKTDLDNGEKPEQGKKPNPKNRQKTEGDPDAAEEKMKGEGDPEGQKSDQPQGGEGGGSKQDKEGNPGSKTQGPGEKTDEAGNETVAQEKTGKSDPKQRPGKGTKSKPGEKDGEGKQSGEQGGKEGGEKPGGEKAGGEKSKGGGKEKGGGKGSEGSASGEGKSPSKGDSKGSASSKSGAGKGSSSQPGKQNPDGASNPTQGGSPVNGSAGPGGNAEDAVSDPEDANLEFNRQAAELVLQRLKDDLNQDRVDPKLLEELGWTEEQLQRFVDRLAKQLEQPAEELSPLEEARRRQFEEMLKSLDLKNSAAKRAGDKSVQREVEQTGGRRAPVPADYKAATEAFTKSLSKQKPKSAPKSK